MKNIILITWSDGKKEAFPTLTKLLNASPLASIQTINNYVRRKKKTNVGIDCLIEKISINRENK